jgi:hypothetical protein
MQIHSVGENVRRSDLVVRLASDRRLIGHQIAFVIFGGTPPFATRHRSASTTRDRMSAPL